MEQPDVCYTTRLFLTKAYGRAILWSAVSNVVRRKVTKSLSGRDRIFVGSAWRGIPGTNPDPVFVRLLFERTEGCFFPVLRYLYNCAKQNSFS